MRVTQAAITLISGITIDANINMAGYKLTALGAPTTTKDSLRYGHAEIRNAEVKSDAAIAGSKLALTDVITNSMVKSDAAIVYSKLSLADSILNSDINSAATIALSKLASLPATLTVAQTEVFSGTSPTSWTDLDINAVVGANVALVVMKVNSGANPQVVAMRANGDGDDHYLANVSGGANRVDNAASISTLLVCYTDASGIIEWMCENGVTTTVDVVLFIK